MKMEHSVGLETHPFCPLEPGPQTLILPVEMEPAWGLVPVPFSRGLGIVLLIQGPTRGPGSHPPRDLVGVTLMIGQEPS